MESLLILFVALTAVAVATQAGVLVAIYLMSKRLSDQMNQFMQETREMMVPMRTITENLEAASANIVEIGHSARDQFRRVEGMVTDTGEVLNVQLERLDRVTREITERIDATSEIVQHSVVGPVREVAAIAKGLSRGVEALLFRKQRSTVDQARQDEELFI